MPINKDLKHLYPRNWKQISLFVRFVREKGRCQSCGTPHGHLIHKLPDGRWFDTSANIWRDENGQVSKWPDMFEYSNAKHTKVVLSAAHIVHDPRINGDENYDKVASWCQRCHLKHDRPYHIFRRKITNRKRYAIGDLFLGDYKQTILEFDITKF